MPGPPKPPWLWPKGCPPGLGPAAALECDCRYRSFLRCRSPWGDIGPPGPVPYCGKYVLGVCENGEFGPPAGDWPSNWLVGGRSLPHCNTGEPDKYTDWEGSTYAALERSTIHIVAVEMADGIGGVLMQVHLDEGKATIGLEARFLDISKVLE